MITPETFYSVQCDKCKKKLAESENEYDLFPSIEDAKDFAIEYEWRMTENKNLCPDCK